MADVVGVLGEGSLVSVGSPGLQLHSNGVRELLRASGRSGWNKQLSYPGWQRHLSGLVFYKPTFGQCSHRGNRVSIE